MTIQNPSNKTVERRTRTQRLLVAASASAIMLAITTIVPIDAQAQAVPAECNPNVAVAGGEIVCVKAEPGEIDAISTVVDDLTIVVGDDDTPTTVNAAVGDGITMSGGGDLAIEIVNEESVVQGAGSGISVDGSTSDTVTVLSSGLTEGLDGDGIEVRSGGGVTDLTVVSDESVGSDPGGLSGIGINAVSDGGGDINILSRDSSGHDGISASLRGYGDISIISTEVARATGSYGAAINVRHIAVGSVDIVAQDAVTENYCAPCAASNDGIRVYGAAATDEINVTAYGTVYGGNGIQVSAGGGADITINSVNTQGIDRYSPNSGAGISALGNGGSIVINSTGSAIGAQTGIGVRNRQGGEDSGVIIDAADVTGRRGPGVQFSQGVGIRVESGGNSAAFPSGGPISITSTGTVLGGDTGILVRNNSRYSTTIVTNNVTGELSHGINATNEESATDLTIVSTGRATGSRSGITAVNNGTGVLTILANGTASEGPMTSYLNADEMTGIDALNRGSDLTITSSGRAAAGGTGIFARNEGSGALTIDAADTYGATYNGITAINTDGGTSLTVNSTGTAAGGQYGIVGANSGSGELFISTDAEVSGAAADGILALNYAGGTSLTIDAGNNISGGRNGIAAQNFGTGGLAISVEGDVIGMSSDGILAENDPAGTSLTIEAIGNIYGGERGINAQNFGAGELAISVEGDVISLSNEGILAQNAPAGTSLTIEVVGGIGGGERGVDARNFGTGELAIFVEDDVIGESGDGIFAVNDSAGTSLTIETEGGISGNVRGIDARNYGTGGLSISVEDDVIGQTSEGIFAGNDAAGTSLTIETEGSISGNGYGIDARNSGTGELAISVAGNVTGLTRDGILALNSSSGTSLTIEAMGSVSGNGYGIDARHSGTDGLVIAVAGDVTGLTRDGISAYNTSDSITSSTGLYQASGTTARGGVNGISASNAAGSLTINSLGSATGETGDGINAANASTATDLSVNSTTAKGDQYGINAANSGSGSTSVRSDIAMGETLDGISARNREGAADLSVTSTGSAAGGRHGIFANNSGSGAVTIEAHDSRGARLDGILGSNSVNGTDLTIMAIGTVEGGRYGILSLGGSGALTITAAGTTTGTSNAGISAVGQAQTSSLIINAQGNVTGGTHGIKAETSGTGGIVVRAAGDVTGERDNGIRAVNNSRNANGSVSVFQGADSTIAGAESGIFVTNKSGALTIDAQGSLTGERLFGVSARGFTTSTDLTITTSGSVQGGLNGINADHSGTGRSSVTASGSVTGGTDGIYVGHSSGVASLNITSSGTVTGTQGDGINAVMFSDGGDATIRSTGDVIGGETGISVFTLGESAIDISAQNTLGRTLGGISAINLSADSTDVRVTSTGLAQGRTYGISAVNAGAGVLRVVANDTLATEVNEDSETISAAIQVLGGGSEVTVTSTGTATGANVGIYAGNAGTGALTIQAADTQGVSDRGIFARNGGTGTDLTVNSTGTTRGGQQGIYASHGGTGELSIVTAGPTIGERASAIVALTTSRGTSLNIDAQGSVSGANNGIFAVHEGSGRLTIRAGGDVSGAGSNGITATSTTSAVDITTTGRVTGGMDGVSITSGGDVSVSNQGQMMGARNAVSIVSSAGTDIRIANSGLLAGGNAALSVVDTSDEALAGRVFLTNTGQIDGRILFGSGHDRIESSGLFNAMGDSLFGAGNDRFTSTGTVNVFGTVEFAGLELFQNFGSINMLDRKANDSLSISGDYEAASRLLVDVDFTAGTSDQLIIDGMAGGVTDVVINNLDAVPEFGTSVVIVQAGAGTEAGAFKVDSITGRAAAFIDFGIFEQTPDSFAVTPTVAITAFQPLKFAEGARAVWLHSAEAWDAALDHRRDAQSDAQQGVWVQSFGGVAKRDDRFEFSSLGPRQQIDLDYRQGHFGVQSGFDMSAEGPIQFGITAGYQNAELEFDGAADSVTYDAYNIGGYVSIDGDRFFGRALLKYDFLDLNVVGVSERYQADFEGGAYGARLELGYRFKHDAIFVEPTVRAEYAAADLDDFTAHSTDFLFDTFDGIRLASGVRLGTQFRWDNADVTPYVSGQFVHEADADGGLTFRSGTSSAELDNGFADDFGRFTGGISMWGYNATSGFLEGSLETGGDHEGYGVRAGLGVVF